VLSGTGMNSRLNPCGETPFGVPSVVRVARVFLPAGDLAPEQGLPVRIGAIRGDAADIEHAVILAVATRNCGKSVRRAWLVQAGAWLGLVVVLAAYGQDITTARGHNAWPAPKMRSARPA
jgi:hypothetical protein